jgi:hypothetical protein
MPDPFLSDAWMDAVEAIHDEAPDPPDAMKDLLVNVTVTGGPDGDREVHLASGHFGRGHAEGAATRLTVPYDVAKDLFIEGNPSAAMQAFMAGKIKVEGDLTKVLALQSAGPPSEEQAAFQARIQAMTA